MYVIHKLHMYAKTRPCNNNNNDIECFMGFDRSIVAERSLSTQVRR